LDWGDNTPYFEPFQHRKFKTPSTFNPVGPNVLEAMILLNEYDFNNRPVFKHSRDKNLSPGEFKAIKELQSLYQIIIKPADKGSCVVVMDKQAYLDEAEKQLSNNSYYLPVDEDPTEKYRQEVQIFIEEMYNKGEIDISVLNYLTDSECRTAKFYLLPKIHKGVNPPPGRPILSANGCPTEKISQLVDHFLNPASITHKSYVKDTTHFLQTLEKVGTLPKGCILTTFDVTSLYTNIPHEEGVQAAKRALNKSRPGNVKPSNDSLINLLEFVLSKNNFHFNEKNYLQICGCAMGSKCSPSFANIYVSNFELQFVYTYHLQPLVWVKFLDDIFCIWQHGLEELNEFYKHINSANPNLKFTMESSENKISFLDTMVKIEQQCIQTDLYCKPTDSHNYLRFNSAHPKSCKESIPYSQFLRVRRICSEIKDFDKNITMLCGHFLKRGYPLSLLEEAAIKARRLERQVLLHPLPKPEKTQPNILVTTYHPHDSCLTTIVKENWDILGKSTKTTFLHENKPLIAYRRPPNLRDLLVFANVKNKSPAKKIDFPAMSGQTPTFQTKIRDYFKPSTLDITQNLRIPQKPKIQTSKSQTSLPKHAKKICKNYRCKYCPYLDTSDKIASHITGEKFTCKSNVSCLSSNVVYGITCKICGQQYVGQTKCCLYMRLREHLYSINNAIKLRQNPSRKLDVQINPQPVGIHFSKPGHNGIKDLKIQILEFIKLHPESNKAEIIRLKEEKK
jgi:hypothetical protein